jgi:hypothetical protein
MTVIVELFGAMKQGGGDVWDDAKGRLGFQSQSE